MKAAVVSMGSIASRWTAEALKAHFDVVDQLDVKDIRVTLGGKRAQVECAGSPVVDYDFIYAKGGYRYANLLRAFTTAMSSKCFMPIKPAAFTNGHDKLLTHMRLQTAGIPQPRTYVVSTVEAAKELLKRVEFPIVMKLPSGTHGKGVMMADSEGSARTMIDALALLKAPFLMQEYVNTGGTDIRAFVVGDEVVAAARRKARDGDPRANIHAGGSMEGVVLDAAYARVAVEAAKVIGAEVCAVDLLEGPSGPLVIEVNLSPGLQGITKASGVDVAQKLALFFHKRTVEWKKERSGREVKELVPGKEFVQRLDFRGSRILLPSTVTELSRLTSAEDVVIKIEKGKVSVEKL